MIFVVKLGLEILWGTERKHNINHTTNHSLLGDLAQICRALEFEVQQPSVISILLKQQKITTPGASDSTMEVESEAIPPSGQNPGGVVVGWATCSNGL